MAQDQISRCATLHAELEAEAQNQRHDRASERAHELVEQLAELRRRQATRESIEIAEQSVALLGALARAQPDVYLQHLVATITELARSLEQRQQFEAAAAAFGSAIDAQRISLAARDGGVEGQLSLIELMSRRAVALAEAGQLSEAAREGGEFVALTRELMPRALPQLCGGLVFLADLSTELGRPLETVEHLRECFELLYATLERELPGTREAVRRLGLRLRDTAAAAKVELDAELLGRLGAVIA